MYSFALESLRGRQNAGHCNVTVVQSHSCNNRVAAERLDFSWILLQTYMGSALTGWKRSWTFAGLVFMQTPFASCFAEILDILGCCAIWGADPACAVCSVSCLHHSTATLSSTSLPFKHEGEMKLNVHIWGRWLAPVLQWYLREIFFMLFQQHRRKWKCFLLFILFSLSFPLHCCECLKTHFTAFLREVYFCPILDQFRPVLCTYDKDSILLW